MFCTTAGPCDYTATLRIGRPAGRPGRQEPATGRSGEDLSLVSTQVLRKVLKSDAKADAGGGFDPYNSG